MIPTYDIRIDELESIDISNSKRVNAEREVYCMPARYEVCERCGGTGTIDCFGPGGVPPEYFAEDPDFAEDYFERGLYDKQCDTCKGLRVVPEPTPITEEDKIVLAAHEKNLKEIADMYAMYESERRMGA